MKPISLPFPDKGLSPNARLHWAAKSRLTKRARADSAWATKAAVKIDERAIICGVDESPIALLVRITPPDGRPRDRDNMIASMKAALDGIAAALGADDVRFRCTYEFLPPAKPGGVEVSFGP